ncbi:MAG: hypothetical protein O2857_24830, partial [Planctomycetota bacterium]|nr:hypothetical protein [Planctomycetota bacterium]
AEKDWRLGFVMTPFQERGYRQNAIGFDSENGMDYLGVFYRFMSRWVHPNENRVLMPWLEEGVVGQFVAYEGRREWGIMVTKPGDHTNDILAEGTGPKFGAIRRPHVKHGETPFNKVKDWVLEWDTPGPEKYPRLFFNRDGLKQMQQDFEKLPDELKNQIKGNRHLWGLLSNDAMPVVETAAQQANGYMKICTHDFLNGGSNTQNTYTHRYQEILRSEGHRLDFVLSAGGDPEARKRLLAWIAFNAYKVSDPDYWAYRGYAGGPSNPNMMSIACNALATCAALLPGHPKQKEWLELCKRLVCADITNSIGPEGAWLESPGYQGAGNSPINMTVLILRNAGIVDLMQDPVYGKLLISVSHYYANLLTPPDPRFEGRRMPMALGDGTPFHSNYTTFLAYGAAGKFPEEAGNAIWCWEEMGKPMQDAPHILLHERVLSDAIKPVPISGKSQFFPGFGAMLRHGFGTGYETFLTYHHSAFSYGHYDDDLGSFSLFAKGAPLCLDWINYSPNEAEYHNRVTYEPDDYPWVVPPLDKFVTHAEADYVRSHETGIYHKGVGKSSPPDAAPDWQRQLILVKDTANPGDATYLVVRDKVFAARPSTTNIWTMAEKGSEKIDGNIARLKGQFGVDVSLFFFKKPVNSLTSKFHHFQPDGLKFPQDQTRIQASSENGGDFGYVLYPLRSGKDNEPEVNELENGIVEIKWNDQKRHLIFLFPDSTKVDQAGIHFEGRAGVLKVENGRRSLIPLEAKKFE